MRRELLAGAANYLTQHSSMIFQTKPPRLSPSTTTARPSELSALKFIAGSGLLRINTIHSIYSASTSTYRRRNDKDDRTTGVSRKEDGDEIQHRI